ncbi:MAG: DNA gyrase inhibitor YacG [Oceanospirillaceae bacterium]|nr:DNA gyrase inhibitor YacG [Oceanospirillaceae bacterium]MCP5351110.1 DNA gyrase inhibitor YacG [Oceanospirillaceae bacterium]
MTLEVKCPTCQKNVQWNSDFPYRPFCCERCKLIDLGEWAAEKHAIPGPELNEELLSGDIPDEFKH